MAIVAVVLAIIHYRMAISLVRIVLSCAGWEKPVSGKRIFLKKKQGRRNVNERSSFLTLTGYGF